MHRGSARQFSSAVVIALVLGVPLHRVDAQTFFNFGGLGVRIGAATPEEAKTGLGWSVDLDAGYIKTPRLRVVLGATGFKADVDRGAPVGGSISAVGGRAGLRFDAFGVGRFTPYAVATVTGHNVSADVSDAGTKQLLEGFYAGAGLGAGMSFALDTAARFAATGEVRRVYVTNISHWAFEAGVRWMPRGRRSYANVGREGRQQQLLREEQIRIAEDRARELERQRLEAVQRDAADRVRQDAAERERQNAAERERQDAAERARLDAAERARPVESCRARDRMRSTGSASRRRDVTRRRERERTRSGGRRSSRSRRCAIGLTRSKRPAARRRRRGASPKRRRTPPVRAQRRPRLPCSRPSASDTERSSIWTG